MPGGAYKCQHASVRVEAVRYLGKLEIPVYERGGR
jgi:hypothetical protein